MVLGALKDEYVGAVVGGVVYDMVADLAEKLTGRFNIDPDLAVLVASYFLARQYPQYKAVFAGIGAVAASRMISLKGVLGAKAETQKTQAATAVTAPARTPGIIPVRPGVIRVPLIR